MSEEEQDLSKVLASIAFNMKWLITEALRAIENASDLLSQVQINAIVSLLAEDVGRNAEVISVCAKEAKKLEKRIEGAAA